MSYSIDIKWFRKYKKTPYRVNYDADSLGYTLNSYDRASDWAFLNRPDCYRDGDRATIDDGSDTFQFRCSTVYGAMALTPLYRR